jgi:PAS domain S-box-containing protein
MSAGEPAVCYHSFSMLHRLELTGDAVAPSQALFDLLPIPAYVFDDADLGFRAVNTAALRRYGYTREEFLKLSLLDIRPEEDRQLVRGLLLERIDDEGYEYVLRHRTSSGEVIYVEVISTPVVSCGRPSHYVVVLEVTEQQRMQTALLSARRRQTALFNHALDAILFLDDEGRIQEANQAAVFLLGRSRDELLTRSVWDMTPPDRLAAAREAWTAFLRVGLQDDEHQMVTGDGSTREVEYRTVANVRPGQHLAFLRDVTSQKGTRPETEQALRDLNTQLRRAAARARVRREEDRARLAREIHDQLGQTLAGLKIGLSWMRDQAVERTTREAVMAKAHDMIQLVDETIVRVRRISSDLRPPALERLGLIAAIEAEIGEFQRRSHIRTRLFSTVDEVALDLGRSTAVFRIFQESLSNAATHAKAGHVNVRLSAPDNTLVLIVEDSGVGVRPEIVESHQSLGLMGMRERATLLGGSVTITETQPHGTTVTVRIPLAERRRVPRERD